MTGANDPREGGRGIDRSVSIECAGEQLRLHPDRAVLWPTMRTLFIADLHLGKAEIFRRSGIPIPEGDTQADLLRLDQLIASYELRRIVLLGDFLHAASPGRSTHADQFAAWRATQPSLEFVVIAGNHDRRAAGRELAESVAWHLDEWQIGPFVCRHHPGASSAGYVLAGHIHPVVFLYGSHRERTRVPVCWVRPDYAVLPSFGSFTGGGDIEPEAGDRLYAFAADRVWSLPAVER
jgi:DNA ligase-associated metallophosphoesterase